MKFKFSLFTAMLAITTALFSSTSFAEEETITLGRAILMNQDDFSANIPLLICRRAKEIQIKAGKAAYIQKTEFKFQNGESRTFQHYNNLKEDETSSWRAFTYTRCVTSITVYGKASDTATAVVTVYGRR